MESRKSSLASREICRFCLTHDSLSSLYDRSKRPNYFSDLPTQILSCVSVEVFPSDGMPTYICDRCRFFMSISYQFKKMCRQGDENIMQYVQKGQALQPVHWPLRLKKLCRINNTPVKSEVKTTLFTEEGTCVEVTSQDQSESEEDEDEANVYVKFDTDVTHADQGMLQNIQLLSPNKEKLRKQSKAQANVKKNDVAIPCQYCDKSFASNKNYARHVALKHKDAQASHAPYGDCEQFGCDQCNEVFYTQDELIYHSAVHATKNLTCPLCHEKFDDVDAITVHIESHVDGVEFICEECRLVFSSKENLKSHMEKHHGMMAETSLEEEEEEEEEGTEFEEGEDYNFSVKQEGDHMVVQLKKTDNLMLPNADNMVKVMTEKESFAEDIAEPYLNTSNIQMATSIVTPKIELPNVTPVKQPIKVIKASPTKKIAAAMVVKVEPEQEPNKPAEKETAESKSPQTAGILRKVEEMKRKNQLKKAGTTVSDNNSTNAGGTSTPTGASDKSLKLLEKELQELKRTSTRGESVKTPTKGEILRGRRTQQLITSTPKPKSPEDRSGTRTPTMEKKPVERRSIPTKENQEPKETKEKIIVNKEEKTPKQNNNNTPKVKEQSKDVKPVKEEKVSKDKEQKTKTVENNGAADRSSLDDNIRRSHRSTKVKDYAKMVKDATSEDGSDDDEEYVEGGATLEGRAKPKKIGKIKTPTQPATKKRGRPRKEIKVEVPSKIMKTTPNTTKGDDSMDTEEKAVDNKIVTAKVKPPADETESQNNQTPVPNQTASPATSGTILLSPTGVPLRKIQSLPPGVTPIALPTGARSTLCEMQIGTKFVKVQRIMMTKAEVEDMAKKGLVEMKDGTMVLKQGVKMTVPPAEQPVPDDAAPKVTTEVKSDNENQERLQK